MKKTVTAHGRRVVFRPCCPPAALCITFPSVLSSPFFCPPHLHHFQLCRSRERRFTASSPRHCWRKWLPAVWCLHLAQPLAPACCSQMGTTRPCFLPTGERDWQQHLAEVPLPESSQNSIPLAGKDGPLGTALELNKKHPRFPRK